MEALEDAGYRTLGPKSLWNRQYRFITRLKGAKSIREINIEHEASAHWMAPFRITLIPRDDSGLLAEDFRTILELLTDFKLVLLEIAFDFPMDSIVDTDYVKRHLLSGKMWLRRARSQNRFHQKWGAGKGSKALRIYVKWEISGTRGELELRSRFLRANEIEDIFDFPRLPSILARKHLWFAQLDEGKLLARLRRDRVRAAEQQEILRQVKSREASLWEVLKYLRQRAKLTNVRRLLRPLDEMNQVVEAALGKWAARWPNSPTRLGGKDKV